MNRWPYLEGVVLPDINAQVELLIGNDVPEALQVKESKDGGPYAIRTLLGWTVNGPLGRKGTPKHTTNFIRSDTKLTEQFERFCNQEFNDTKTDTKATMSRKDRRALNIMEDSVQLKNNHYEIALPWKNPSSRLPNNKPLAEHVHRLKLLKRRLERDTGLSQKYSAFVSDLVKNGYAQKVPKNRVNRSDGAVWYLPHHPVIHPQKPGKVRVVFDCAANYRGTSLNAISCYRALI